LPTASASVLGGVKIGANVSIASGVISVHNPLTIGTANGLSLSTQVLSLALATTAANGALSATDKTYIDLLKTFFEYDSTNNAIKALKSLYSTGEVSAYGIGSGGSSGGGVDRLDAWADYDSTKSGWVLSALLGNDLNTRVGNLEGGSALTLNTTGAGNAITSISKAGTVITATKGATFSLDNHVHTGVYEPVFTKNTAFNKNFGTTSGTVAQGNDSRINNGQTAYSWGDFRDYGLGRTAANVYTGGDADVPVETGLYSTIASSTANTPIFASSGSLIMLQSGASGGTFKSQIWVKGNVNTNNQLFFRHRKGTSGWNSWDEIYHTGNLTSLSQLTDNIGVATHIANKSNPHSVTKAQVGLSNVDNTSDLLKPISNAVQTALNLKAPLANPTFTGSVTAPTFEGSIITPSGVEYLRTLNTAISEAGWYRVFVGNASNISGPSVILNVNRSYAYASNESYTFSINVAYNGAISITQLSGIANVRGIPKIRVDYVNSGVLAVDIYYSLNSSNRIYISGSGTGKFQTPTLVTAPTGTTVGFDTVNGVKSNLGFTGNLTGNAASATKLQTARTLTIGNTGKTFDGTANVVWSLAEIGALPLTGGTMSNTNLVTNLNADLLDGYHASSILKDLTTNYGATITSANDYPTNLLSGIHRVHISNVEYASILTGYDYNGKYWQLRFRPTHDRNIFYRNSFSSSWSAIAFTDSNVASATKLQTPRTIWGQSFDGSGNVSGALSGATTISASSTITATGNLLTSANLIANTGITIAQTAGTGIGLSLYNSAGLDNSTNPAFGIMFAATVNKGTHGAVTGDWATYFTMSTNTGRGWIFTTDPAGTTGNIASISNTGNITANGEITAYVASDRRLKHNITPLVSSLDIIDKLNPVSYYWNQKAKELNPMKSDSLDYGLIAQEVENVLPGVVHGIFDDKYKSIDYIKLIPIMIAAIKELKQKVNKL
jgi:hypothetical protein